MEKEIPPRSLCQLFPKNVHVLAPWYTRTRYDDPLITVRYIPFSNSFPAVAFLIPSLYMLRILLILYQIELQIRREESEGHVGWAEIFPWFFRKKKNDAIITMECIGWRYEEKTEQSTETWKEEKIKKDCQCGKRTSSKRMHFKKISSYPCVFAGIALNMSRYSYHISANN